MSRLQGASFGRRDLPWVPDPSLLADVPFYMFYIQERHSFNAYSFPFLRRLMAGLSSVRARRQLWRLRWEPRAARMLASVTRRATTRARLDSEPRGRNTRSEEAATATSAQEEA